MITSARKGACFESSKAQTAWAIWAQAPTSHKLRRKLCLSAMAIDIDWLYDDRAYTIHQMIMHTLRTRYFCNIWPLQFIEWKKIYMCQNLKLDRSCGNMILSNSQARAAAGVRSLWQIEVCVAIWAHKSWKLTCKARAPIVNAPAEL